MKFTLILNSHSLSNFSVCESKYLYSEILRLRPAENKKKMEVGTQIARWLELYYYNKIKASRTSFSRVLVNPLIWHHEFEQKVVCTKEEAQRYFRACINYFTVYSGETWKPLATEKGFSRVLYEDADNYFVYEGRPDLHAMNGDYSLVSDHKVQFSEYEIYPQNNQALGYLWAVQCKEFVYNYIKILKKDTQFRRTVCTFDSKAIENWRSNTIETYFRVKHSIQKQKWNQSYQCTDVYGQCSYTGICEAYTPQTKLFVIQANYKVSPYRSW